MRKYSGLVVSPLTCSSRRTLVLATETEKKGGRIFYKIWILLLTRFDGVWLAHLELTANQVMCGDGFYAEFP